MCSKMSTSNKFEDSAIIVDDSDTDDFRDGVIKELTEENQQLRKKCKAANKSLAALKEQLRSLKEEDDVIEDLTEENEQLKKEYDTAISECAALEKQLRSLQKRSSTEKKREESPTSSSDSSDIEFQEDSLGKETQTDLQYGQPPIDQSGEDELVGGNEPPDTKKGIEAGNTMSETDQIEEECIKTTVFAIYHFHQRKEHPSSIGGDSALQQPTSGINNAEEMLSEVYYSILCVLETAAKILAQREPVKVTDVHNRELKSFCDKFLEEVFEEFPDDFPTSDKLVGMRNAAAHANVEYRLKFNPGNFGTSSVILYEKKKGVEVYNEIYSSSTDTLSQSCYKLRGLFLYGWKPVTKYLHLQDSRSANNDMLNKENQQVRKECKTATSEHTTLKEQPQSLEKKSKEDEVLSPVEEESTNI